MGRPGPGHRASFEPALLRWTGGRYPVGFVVLLYSLGKNSPIAPS